MYLTKKEINDLTDLILDFEVAFRSYIADRLLNRFKTEHEFTDYLNQLEKTIKNSSIIFSGLLQSKIKAKDSKDIYRLFISVKDKIGNDYIEIDVPNVGTMIGVTFVLFNELFYELGSILGGSIHYFNAANNYHRIRNAVSHRGGSNISVDEALNIIFFIEKISNYLDNSFFWYVKKNEILDRVLSIDINNDKEIIKINNFNEIIFSKCKFVCRETMINNLINYVVGRESGIKRSASICLYGYGGVGKTALIHEFINIFLKEYRNISLPKDYKLDFILYFTFKEESLEYNERDGSLYIQRLKKRIFTFEDLKNRIYSYLNVNAVEEITQNGIIIIDNYETIPLNDKEEINDFIRFDSPRNIQYIITSRNLETTEDSIHVGEFIETEGIRFINEYIEANSLKVYLDNEQKTRLVSISKGNTLVLVLSLNRLHYDISTVDSIENELDKTKYLIESLNDSLNVPQVNLEKVADFMYKNTFDEVFNSLKELGIKIEDVIKVLSLYDEPVDLFTLSNLCDETFVNVERACNVMSSKLIIDKRGDLYILNDFANKYITIRFFSNIKEYERLRKKVNDTKSQIKRQLEYMENKLAKSPLLGKILKDWQVESYIDSIVASTIFYEYENIKNKLNNIEENDADNLLKNFLDQIKELEHKSQHPYLKYQKARIARLFYDVKYKISSIDLLDVIKTSYDDTIMSIEYYYSTIRNTASYASVLWIYGEFLMYELKQYKDACAILEKSKKLFEKVDKYRDEYCKCVLALSMSYIYMYDEIRDFSYLEDARILINTTYIKPKLMKSKKWVYFELKKRDRIINNT